MTKSGPRLNLGFSKTTGMFYSLVSIFAVPLAFSNVAVPITNMVVLSLAVTATSAAALFSFAGLSSRLALGRVAKNIAFAVGVLWVGLMRGFALWWLTPNLGIEQNATLSQRLAISVLMTLFWLPAISLLVESNRAYTRKLEVSLNQVSYAMRHNDSRFIAERIDALEAVIDLKANLSLIASSAISRGSASLPNSADEITRQIDEILRPLSHEMWSQTPQLSSPTNWMGLLRDSLQEFKVKPVRLLPAIGLLGAFGGLTFTDWKVAIILSAVPVAWVSLLLSAEHSVRHRLNSKRTVGSQLTFILFAGISATVLCDLVGIALGSDSALLMGSIWVWGAPLPIAMLFVIDLLLTKVQAHRSEIISDLDRKLHTLEDRFESNFASFLHNSIQSELTAISLQLRTLEGDEDSKKFDGAMVRLQAISQMSIGDEFLARTKEPLKHLQALVAAWDGIASVNIDIADGVLDDVRVSSVLVPILEEAVTNSVRHGGASTVNIRVWPGSGNTQVEIWNDGIIRDKVQSGLGTQWINSMSLEDYTPVASGSGAFLRFEL